MKNILLLYSVSILLFSCKQENFAMTISSGKAFNIEWQKYSLANIAEYAMFITYSKFEAYVKPKLIGKTQIKKNEASECYTIYLGEMVRPQNKIKYQVISQHYTVQAAIIKHGISRLIFLNTELKTTSICDVDGREYLPVSIAGNELRFKDGQTPLIFILPEEVPSPSY